MGAETVIKDYVIIIGAMKAGTTALFDLLSRHSAIAPCVPKEPGFFAFEDVFAKGFDWYEGLFGFDPARHRYALEASTDYTKYPHCPDVVERMVQSKRRFKLIYIVRHPLRRIESHARHAQVTRKELGQTVSMRSDHGLDAGVSEVSMDASRYALQIDQYRIFYDAGDLLILSFEDMIGRPDETARRVFEFLDLPPPEGGVSLQKRNEAKKRLYKKGSPRLWRAAHAIAPLRYAVKSLVPENVRAELRRRMRFSRKLEGRFRLSEGEEIRLLAELRSDLERLRDEYRIDIKTLWGLK